MRHRRSGADVARSNLLPFLFVLPMMKRSDTEQPKQPRRPRHDRGSVKATPRDTLLLTWIGEQYAARFDHVVSLVARSPGPGVHPDGLSESAVRQVVDRWRRAGWIGYQQFLAGEPPWLWLTRAGLAAYDLASYKPIPPAIGRLRHIHAVNTVRLHVEKKEDTWISERAIRAGLYAAQSRERDARPIPDGILCTSEGDIAVEVELTQKKPDDLFHKIESLLLAHNPHTHQPAYMAIWFYTPDERIKKALETAREAHINDRYASRRASMVQVILAKV